MTQPTTISIDGTEYVRKDAAPEMATDTDGLEYVIIRTYSAGVHAGYLNFHDGKEVELKNARRLWQWAGAMTLSQLAVDGTSKPSECKFSVAVPSITLTEAIEIIPATAKAQTSIEGVAEWKM